MVPSSHPLGYHNTLMYDTIRIDAACQLLKTTTLSLKDISEKCGYANQYYFSTTFKKKKSKTPSAYREDLDINN